MGKPSSLHFDLAQTAQLYSLHPLVGCIDNFVDASEILEIETALAKMELEPAMVGRLEGAVLSENRVADHRKIEHGACPPVQKVTEKVGELFRLKPSLCEYPEYIRYEEGGEFKLHFDAVLKGNFNSDEGADPAKPSQRILTAILYLNDDFEGGTTVFPRLDIELRPKRGTLAFWQNTKHGSPKVHPMSMHQGCPVTKGVKGIISFWFRDRPWQIASSE